MEPTAPAALSVRILSNGRELPSGAPLRCIGDGSASLVTGELESALHLVLPTGSTSEVRWMVDRLMRSTASALDFSTVDLCVDDDVDADLATALALDFAGRTPGTVANSERVRARVDETLPHEERYKAWVDEDPSDRTSLAIARDARELASRHDTVSVEVLAEDALAEHGLRLLLAVGASSEVSPARLVIARYTPTNASSEAPLMLLGKGVTFDTGGINVKPYESFVSMMKNDMAGAALAYSLFCALVEADHARPVALVIPCCENAVGSRSMRPGALVKSYRGPQVRIDHTDAEGRLILADALAFASDQLEPAQILSFATLTTAALVAYGPFATPVHFADSELRLRLESASARCGEDLHFFPERIWHLEANRDKEADLRNTARLPGHATRAAGSRNAAHFLKHFTDRPLCHFDIFGSTWNWSGEAPGAGYGATGAPLRTLLSALR